MPNVARRRVIDAPVESVWAVVSDPYHLPRWWPRHGTGRERARRDGQAQPVDRASSRPSRGAACAPTSAASARPPSERFVWEQDARRHAVRAHPAQRGHRDRPRRRGGGATDVRIESRQALRGLSRLGSPMMRRATGAQARPRRSTGSRRRSRERARLRHEVVGVGPGGAPAGALARRRSRCSRRRSARLRTRRPSSSTQVTLPEARPLPDARSELRWTPTPCSPRPRTGFAARRPELPRPDPAAARRRSPSAPDAVLMPADAEQVAARARRLFGRARRGRARSAAAPASSAGWTPDRGDFECLVSLDLARMRDVEVDRRSLTARLGPGLRGPEAEAALNAAGVTLGHFPAVLRVRDDRRLRRDPLGGPGLDGLRALRRAGDVAPASPRRPGS